MVVFLILLSAGFAPQEADVDALIRTLSAEEPGERDRAERRLVDLGVRSRPAVLRAAREGDAERTGRARRILTSYAPNVRMEELYEAGFRRETALALPTFAARFWSGDPQAVAAALREVSPKATPQDLRTLATFLERGGMHDDVRDAFADVLEGRRDPALAPVVVPLLGHRQRNVRERALRALVAAGAKDQTTAILPLLEDPECVHACREALEKLGAAVPGEVVRRMLGSPDEAIRFQGVAVARRSGLGEFKRELIQALLKARSYEPWTVQDAVARSGPSWTDLQPLFAAAEGPARLAGLRLALRLRMPEAFEASARLLDDPHEEARKEAIETLVFWGGAEAVGRAAEGTGPGSLLALARLRAPVARERALEAIGSRDPALRRAGLTALRTLDAHEAAGRIERLLEDPAAEVRAEAARILPHLAGDAIGPRLAARLEKETDPAVQARLLEAVAETGCAAAAPHVLRLLEEGKDLVAYRAAEAAGALRLREAVPTLARRRAYEPLLQLRPENLVDLLRPQLKPPPKEEKDPDVLERLRRRSDRRDEVQHNDGVLYLLYVSPPGAREFLVECLNHGIVPRYPVEGIRFQRAIEAFPWLVDEIDRGGWTDVSGAGRLLASWGRRDLADRAVTWLSSNSRDVRDAGEELLGGLRIEEKIPELAALYDSPKEDVKWAAFRTLSRIGGPKTVEIFRARLHQGTPMNRAYAGLFLSREGDREAIPTIERFLDEEDAEIRKLAAQALAELKATASFERVVRAFRRGPGNGLSSWHWYLVHLGGARGRATVSEYLSHPDLDVRQYALRMMGWGGGYVPGESARVESFLDDPDLGSEAQQALATMDPERYGRLAANPGRTWKPCSVTLDRTVGAPFGIPGMIALLDRGSSHAASVLGKWQAQEAVEPLARALHVDDPNTRRSAAAALARLGDARGLGQILKTPRFTTPTQGRMCEELLGLNGLRQPDLLRKALSLRWERSDRWYCTLEQAVGDLAKRLGVRVAFSEAIDERDRQTPCSWPRQRWDFDEVVSNWNCLAAFVLEPDEIRVMTPEEAWRFWESWARETQGK